MTLEIKLPKELELSYCKINSKFAAIRRDLEKKHYDREIPQDDQFLKEIIDFIIKVFEHIIKNYDSLNLENWIRFLYGYYHEFYYGPDADDYNYLDDDDSGIGEIFMIEMNDLDKIPSKENLIALKEKFILSRGKISR